MAKRKRGPGGGRKPMGNVAKSAAFTTRIEPATRRALNEAARADGLTVSVMAERLLKLGLAKPAGEPRNRALATAITMLAENIERDTGKDWTVDDWTGKALRYAVEALLFHVAPTRDDEAAVPPAIERETAKMPDDFAKRFREPAGFGHISAYKLIDELRAATSTEPPNEWTPIIASERPRLLALIARDIGVANPKGKRQ